MTSRHPKWLTRGSRALRPLKHLGVFIAFLLVASVGLIVAQGRLHFEAPPLGAWELSALCHVYLVAMQTAERGHLEFTSRRFNKNLKVVVIGLCLFFVLAKAVILLFETDWAPSQGQAAAPVSEALKWFKTLAHVVSPYVIVAPLFAFLLVNGIAWWRVKREARVLGFEATEQERYIVGMIQFVDLPVVVPFGVLLLYLRAVPIASVDNGLLIGVAGCVLLVVSNLLTGVYDEHWSGHRVESGEAGDIAGW